MMHLFLDVLYGVFQILEVLGEIVDEILHVVQLVLGVVVVLGQLADFSHHVVDAVVEVSLILLETIDESDEAVVAVNLNVGIVVYQHAAERDSEQEDNHGVDHVTDEVTQCLTDRVLLALGLLLHDNLGWLRDGARLGAADQLGLADGLDLGLDTLLLVEVLILEVNDGVRDEPGKDGNLVLFLSSGGRNLHDAADELNMDTML